MQRLPQEPQIESPRRSIWRRTAWLGFAVTAFLLGAFLVLESLGVSDSLSPAAWAGEAGPLAALVGFTLLPLYIVLPVPSSLVMTANGALFGLWGGAVLSEAGTFTSSLLAYAVGSRLQGVLGQGVPEADAAHAREMLTRWGIAAVALSRPLPLLAETPAIVAGAARMDPTRFAVGGLLGSVPIALVYAAIGASAVKGTPLLPLLALYLAVAFASVVIGRARRENHAEADLPAGPLTTEPRFC